jgi:subtilisin family serine protease
MRLVVLTAIVLAAWPAGQLSAAGGDDLVQVDAAHAAGYTGRGVTIAVLDTGVDDRVPELTAHVVDEHCIVPPSGCPADVPEQDGPGSAQDDQGHGTAIAAVVHETAPDASLVIVKVTDANGRTTSRQVAAGLDWVRLNHPEARIVNVSLTGDIPLSGDCSQLTASLASYAATVDALRADGVSVFAAAGNSGRTNGLPAPACFPSTVAVGAVYARGVGTFTVPDICRDATTSPGELACFSNTSSELDLLAVGGPVETVGLGGVTTSLIGTSAASAQAAGVAALQLQANPTLSPDALLSALRSTGTPVADQRDHVVQPIVPRINAAAALGLVAPVIPRLVIGVRPIAFGRIRPNQSVSRTLTVRNTGTGTLTIRITSSSAAVHAGRPQLRVAAKAGKLTVTFRPTRPGRYRGVLRLATDDPSHLLVRIPFSGTAAT